MEARERARRKDRLAAAVITLTASSVLVSTLLLFFYLLREVWPMTRSPRLVGGPITSLKAMVVFPGELPSTLWGLRADGVLAVWPGGSELALEGITPPLQRAGGDRWGRWLWVQQREALLVFRITARAVFAGQDRELRLRATLVATGPLAGFEPLAIGGGAFPVMVGRQESRGVVRLWDGQKWREQLLPWPSPTRAVVEDAGRRVWVATGDRLGLWDVEQGQRVASAPLTVPPSAITLLLGDLTCFVGDQKGAVVAWEAYREEGQVVLEPKGQFVGPGPVLALAPSPRDKNLAVARPGSLELLNLTAKKVRASISSPFTDIQLLAFAPRANRLLLSSREGHLHQVDIQWEHPEITWGTIFGKVRYEGYRQSQWVWQSTGGSNAFEGKFSLVPLILGSFKGALYGMLFSGPLGLLAAVYTSQFLSRRLRQLVKPAVELLAGVPSVVVGFVAALVAAPWLARNLFAVFLALGAFPVVLVATGVLLERLPRRWQLVYERRWEGWVVGILSLLCILGSFWLAGPLEQYLFPEGLVGLLHNRWGVVYDQRNALVAGFALGFAVLPLIFSVAEEALSNVPESLTNAALSLGASQAQAVRRVVIPAAAPGLVAALLLGFGRALGETMIVLMASGNTPLLSLSPFNGMRTLSACIAVELPEAAYGETLYRVLMLAALLLFVFTFVINLVGQLVGRKLAARFGAGR